MAARSDELHDALSPLLAAHGLELVDVELPGPSSRSSVDRTGGVDLDALAEANRAVSAALDELDPIPGRYTLEVSSPGVERRLRTPAHFARAVGETVSVRTARRRRPRSAGSRARWPRPTRRVHARGPRRARRLARLAYDEVERARTVFEWGAAHRRAARPGRSGRARARAERVTTP